MISLCLTFLKEEKPRTKRWARKAMFRLRDGARNVNLSLKLKLRIVRSASLHALMKFIFMTNVERLIPIPLTCLHFLFADSILFHSLCCLFDPLSSSLCSFFLHGLSLSMCV